MRVSRRRLPPSIRVPRRWGKTIGPACVVIALAFVILGRTPQRSTSTSAPVDLAPAAVDDWNRYHDRSFTVTHVVDGDTLDIDASDQGKPSTRIRLWGVDSPELAHGDTSEMHFGPEAAAFAQDALDGKTVHVVLSPKRTRGKYGRLLAYVFLERGGRMFNEMLIEGGYAYADLRFKHHYFDQFQAMDKRARRAGVGLWAEVTPEGMPPWKQRFEARDTIP